MHRHVMLDVETLGLRPGCAVLSIGICRFGAHGIDVTNNREMLISPKSCEALGLKVDIGTVLWWMQQSDAARAKLKKAVDEGEPVRSALLHIAKYLQPDDIVWSNGIDFDWPIVGYLFDLCGLQRPWTYNNQRCYRTIMRTLGKGYQFRDLVGTSHSALDDAVWQANRLIQIGNSHFPQIWEE